jgi:L-fuconolactonase
MLIADSQVHIWERRSPRHPWKPGRHIEGPFTVDDLLREMDQAGVARAVLVPPSWDDGGNDYALKAARLHPDRCVVMGRLDVEAPDARAALARVRDQRGLRGLRCSVTAPRWTAMISEGRLDWFFEEAEAAGLPLMVMATHAMMPLIDRLVQRHPQLKLALCHLALPVKEKDDAAFADLDQLLALAKRPNVMVKLSGLPGYTTDAYPYRRLHPWLRRVYDAYGPKRMFWGTDLSRLPCTYRQAVTMFTEEIDWLSAGDQAWIMGRGLCDWLGWN